MPQSSKLTQKRLEIFHLMRNEFSAKNEQLCHDTKRLLLWSPTNIHVNRPNTEQSYTAEDITFTDVPDPSVPALWASRYRPWSIFGICHHPRCFCCRCQPPSRLHKHIKTLQVRKCEWKAPTWLVCRVCGPDQQKQQHAPVELSVSLGFCSCRTPPEAISKVVLYKCPTALSRKNHCFSKITFLSTDQPEISELATWHLSET